MKWISWGEKQITGHADMDHGHKLLVGLINRLADAMANNKPKEVCSNMLEQFIAEIRTHFQTEEQLMDQRRYSKAQEHKDLHALLLKDVLAFKASYDSGLTSEFTTLLVILDQGRRGKIEGDYQQRRYQRRMTASVTTDIARS